MSSTNLNEENPSGTSNSPTNASPEQPFLKLTESGTTEYDGTLVKYYEFETVGEAGSNEFSKWSDTLKSDLLMKTIGKEAIDRPYPYGDANYANNTTFLGTTNGGTVEYDIANGVSISSNSSRSKQLQNKWDFGGGKPKGGYGGGYPKKNDDDPFKDTTMDCIGGLDSQIQWLQQCILKPLKSGTTNPWGLQPPKGVLFYGPPGTGKTLLARAFGNELSKDIGRQVKFFHRKGSDCFSKWFGESSRNLRDLFADAIKNKPSIIFFDELDGLCPNRDGANINEAVTSVVTTLLGLMDTLPAGDVFVFGATNLLEAIDPAMRRPGRFDKHLEFLPPNLEARQKIIQINTQKWKRSRPDEKAIVELGQKTVGFTGADLEKLCREAFFIAFDRHVPQVQLNSSIANLEILQQDWNVALTKVKPSNSSVFGSTLYVPVLPDQNINPLLSTIQNEVVARIVPHIPRRSETAMHLGEISSSSTEISSFLIFNESSMVADAVTLESMILPGVLAHSKLNDLPVYILSQDDILTTPQHEQILKVTRTIDQALSSFKPCILLIPSLDRLVTEMSGLNVFISRQLMQLRGKPVLLLATSSCNPSKLPAEFNIRNIFRGPQRSHFVRKPNAAEREEFFRSIFAVTANNIAGQKSLAVRKQQEQALKKIWDETVERTANDSIDLILVLHDALLQASKKHFKNSNKQPMLMDFRKLLLQYSMDKLKLS